MIRHTGLVGSCRLLDEGFNIYFLLNIPVNVPVNPIIEFILKTIFRFILKNSTHLNGVHTEKLIPKY